MYSYLQSSASRFEQVLPGEAKLHSDKRYDQSDERQGSKGQKAVVVVVVVFYYCDMGEDWYNCYTLKTSTQLTPRAIVGL